MRNNAPSTIGSPCISICVLNDDDICVGCYRTAKEITFWGKSTDEEKLAILKECGKRSKANNPFA